MELNNILKNKSIGDIINYHIVKDIIHNEKNVIIVDKYRIYTKPVYDISKWKVLIINYDRWN